jgi:hypothetical protein
MARHLAGRCDLKPQGISDLPLQRMLGHRWAADHATALHAVFRADDIHVGAGKSWPSAAVTFVMLCYQSPPRR